MCLGSTSAILFPRQPQLQKATARHSVLCHTQMMMHTLSIIHYCIAELNKHL